jgi:(2Fe-2S) ferredoxin
MKTQKAPYARVIFVCTNVREDDSRPSCGHRGAMEICERLKEEVKKRGLKGKIRAMKSGCMDFCEAGPNVMVFPDGVWHSGVTEKDVPALADMYLALENPK